MFYKFVFLLPSFLVYAIIKIYIKYLCSSYCFYEF